MAPSERETRGAARPYRFPSNEPVNRLFREREPYGSGRSVVRHNMPFRVDPDTITKDIIEHFAVDDDRRQDVDAKSRRIDAEPEAPNP